MKKNISRNLLVVIIGTLLLLAVAACQTDAKFERTNSSDCLILFPSVLINAQSSVTARTYYLNLSDGQRIRLGQYKNTFIPIVIKYEGVSIVSVSSMVTDQNLSGKDSKESMNYSLPYEAGKAIITDITFVEKLERVDSNNFMSYWGFIKTTDEQRAITTDQFMKKNYSSSWQL